MEKIGFGIIGLGNVAAIHAYALEQSEFCFLSGVYSPDKEKGEKYRERYGCSSYNSLDEFFGDKRISVVIIALPSGMHEEYAIKALNAAKHVLIEKPIEINEERAERIIEYGRKKGLIVGGIFQNRFYDGARLIKRAISEGRFGRIVMIEASLKWLREQSYYDSALWRGTKEIDGGGVLMNQGIHAIDLLLYFGGDCEEIEGYTALLSHERIDVEDNAVAVLRFRSGALGIINGSTSIYPGAPRRIEVLGTHGTAVFEDEALTTWKFKNERKEDEEIRTKYGSVSSKGGSNSATDINYIGHMRAFDDFASAIIEKRDPLVTGEEAIKSIKVISAIYRSAKSGRSEKL